MLALFLDRHGVKSVVFNTDESARWHPKGSTQNSRTMEHYRRLGLAATVRHLGLPQDFPTDVYYLTRLNGHELARVYMPSEHEKVRLAAAAPQTAQNFEPIHRANQMYVEKALLEHATTRPNITLRFGWQVGRFTEDAGGVSLEAHRVRPRADGDPAKASGEYNDRDLVQTGESESWRAQYLVGCDGGPSHVRRTLGIRYLGHDGLQQAFVGGRMVSTYLRAPTLHSGPLAKRPGWQYWVVNPKVRTAYVALNGKDEFIFWTKLANETDRPDDAVIAAAITETVGEDVPFTMLAHRTWTAGVALWAERLWSGNRVFLAGDAIHLFTPTGGFGMNTGIDGVANLSWKLAACLQGWGGPSLLGSYEAERKPIAERNTQASRALAKNVGAVTAPEGMEDDTPEGAAARRESGLYLATFGEEFASIGVQLGVRYDGSPIIVPDGTPPADSFTDYVPSSVPGGRAPHFWFDPPGLPARRSLYDRFGIGFTLLRIGAQAPEAGPLVAAATARGVPLEVVDVPDPLARELYGCDLALVRPDQHVAWRGARLPQDCAALLARVTGHP